MYTQVDDILVQQAQAVMVVESPHRTEVETGIPLSGESGKVVSRVLIDRNIDTAIGPLCKNGSVRLSVVNTFSQPLQFDVDDRSRPDLLVRLNSLKYPDSPNIYKDEIKQILEATPDQVLVDNYKERLIGALGAAEHKRVVVCGVFAQAVFEWTFEIAKTKFKEPFRCQVGRFSLHVFYIEHPSPKSGDKGSAWEESKNSKAVSDLKKFIGPITL